MSTRRGLAGKAETALETVAVTALAATAAVLAFYWVSRRSIPPRAPQWELDIVALQRQVLELTGRTGIDVNNLGGGIVELVGESKSAAEAKALLDTLNGAPGVEVVLDRLWVRTPRLVS